LYKRLLFLGIILIIASCINNADERKPVAKVNNKILFEDDIKAILPEQLTNDDSLMFVNSYVNKWARQQLLLQKAKINLDKEEESIDKLVQQYKQDLLINKYKEAIVKQELDTLVTQSDIDSFYSENKEIFKLNEELIKLRYIYFGKDVLNPEEFISLFKSDDYKSNTKIIEQELELKSYYLNDSIWIAYDDFIIKTPFLNKYDRSDFLKKNKFIHSEDSTGVYLVKVKDVLLRNEIAPISYAVPTIKQMILHKKKLELIRKIEETLIEDAIKNKNFQIY
jgi:hypothetical protein